MTDEFDRTAARAAHAVRAVVTETADPNADLAVVLAEAGLAAPPTSAPRWGRPRWALTAAAALVAVVAVGAVALTDDEDDPTLVPATVPTTVPATDPVPEPSPTSTSTSATSSPTTIPATAPDAAPDGVAAAVSACNEAANCVDLAFGADGTLVVLDGDNGLAIHGAGGTRSVTPQVPLGQLIRIITVGPNGLAYLLAAEADGDRAAIVAIDVSGGGTGDRTVVDATAGLVDAFITPLADGIAVVGTGSGAVVDGTVPYVDGAIDESRARWTQRRTDDFARYVLRDEATGGDVEVPVDVPGAEEPVRRDVRPLLDGRIVVTVVDEVGRSTAWVLDPATATWTSQDLGDVSVHAVDPTGRVLTRTRTDQTWALVLLS